VRFLLTASGSYSRAVHTSISPCARSLFVAGDRYLSLQCVIVSFVYVLYSWIRRQTKSPSSLIQDEERYFSLSCYHLHSPISRDIGLSKYVHFVHTFTRLRGPPASSTLTQGDFFSRLQGLLHDWLTCRLLSYRLLSGRNG
jgi:hypothetical protein